MVIKRSSAREIEALLADLDAATVSRREAAVARLAVIGTRAVGRLVDVVRSSSSSTTRVAAMQALEPACDARALDAALDCIDGDDVALADQAIGVLRRFLASDNGPRVLDRLASLALDTGRRQALRVAALDALGEMPGRTVRPIWRQLSTDTDSGIRRRASLALGHEEPEPAPADVLQAAAAGTLPDDPRVLKAAVLAAGSDAPLPTLHSLIEAVRRREEEGHEAAIAPEWRAVRGTLHRTLAARQSTVALYDLRETFEQTDTALPIDFVEALSGIGDRSCLEAILTAYSRTNPASAGHDWWRTHLAAACREIVRRERLTERHAAIRHLRAKWPEAAAMLPRKLQ